MSPLGLKRSPVVQKVARWSNIEPHDLFRDYAMHKAICQRLSRDYLAGRPGVLVWKYIRQAAVQVRKLNLALCAPRLFSNKGKVSNRYQQVYVWIWKVIQYALNLEPSSFHVGAVLWCYVMRVHMSDGEYPITIVIDTPAPRPINLLYFYTDSKYLKFCLGDPANPVKPSTNL